MLIAMAGPPGSGKSTIAALAAQRLGCALVAVDPIEAAMWGAGIDRTQPTGLGAYVVAEAVAREQLRLGHDVVIDAVNDVEEARQQWRDLGSEQEVDVVFVEVVAGDLREHRRRLAERHRDIEGFPEPDWESIGPRRLGLAEWKEDRLRLDFLRDPGVNADAIVAEVERRREPGAAPST